MSSKHYLSPYVARKENYQSLNLHSPLVNDYSQSKQSGIQQRQIQNLQQKVDIILQHNQELNAQNNQLKRRLAELQANSIPMIQRDRLSRHQADGNEYVARKIKGQMMIKVRQCEVLAVQLENLKQIAKREAEGFKIIIDNLTFTNEQLKSENKKLITELSSIRGVYEEEKKMALTEQKRKYEEQVDFIERSKLKELSDSKTHYENIIHDRNVQFEKERDQWQTRKTQLINKLQDNHTAQINELRRQIMTQFKEQMSKLEQEASQRCRNQRQKAEKFIRQSFQGEDNIESLQNEVLKKQIQVLRQSLENRKKFISQLVNQGLEKDQSNENSKFQELIELKKRLKQNIDFLLRENEDIKIRTAIKHQLDVKQMVRVYEDKIDVITCHLKYMNEQNDRLRGYYEDELTNKIKQKRLFESEISKLKNLIRKLRVELHGIQQQFKLNIDGIRENTNTFSMTMMKSVIQDKQKANFYEEENRKLRMMYENHQKELQIQKQQGQQKISYYENKLERLKRLIQDEKEQLEQKERIMDEKFNQKDRALRDNISKERAHLQELINEMRASKQKVDGQYFILKEKSNHQEVEIKQKMDLIDILKSRINQNEAHIERLRMQLEMAGVTIQKDAALDQWKSHFERIIITLEKDKEDLKHMNDQLSQKLQKIVYKYKILENSIQKTSETIAKRQNLDQKIINIGIDSNLIKNLAELFLPKQISP